MARLCFLALTCLACASAPLRDPCGAPSEAGAASTAPRVLVSTASHRLHLCEGARSVGAFPVSLGRGGVSKRARGDRRTPLGRYPLGTPRASARFGTFIPIGYPTPAQVAAGSSGADVGIHGPARGLAWAGGAARWFDWTQGCVAVATDAEIAEIAAFVGQRRVRLVDLGER